MNAVISKSTIYPRGQRARQPLEASARRHAFVEIEQVKACSEHIEHLFAAIKARDVEAILGAYAPDCRIDHPLVGKMTKFQFSTAILAFFRQTPDFQLECQVIHADTQCVETQWTLTHAFHLTGRMITLGGTTTYLLSERKIKRQTDRFDRRAWSWQALGMTGLLLSFMAGWRSFVERELREALGMPRR